MKTILTASLLILAVVLQAQNNEPVPTDTAKQEQQIQQPPAPPAPPIPASPDSTDDADTTVVEIPGMRIIIRESKNGNTEVRVERGEKDDIIINEEGIEVEVEVEVGGTDSTKEEKVGGDSPEPEELKDVRTRYFLLEMGVNGYHRNGSITTPIGYPGLELNYSKSVQVSLDLFRQRLNLIGHHVNLEYGMGLSFNDYRFSQDVIPVARQTELTFTPLDEPVKKAKLTATYLEVPLLLNFESKPEDLEESFRLSAGAFGGFLLGARTKYKTVTGRKVKERDDFNLSTFRYGLTGSIGYGWFNLYVDYALNEMFKDNEGPEVYPFSIGIVLLGF